MLRRRSQLDSLWQFFERNGELNNSIKRVMRLGLATMNGSHSIARGRYCELAGVRDEAGLAKLPEAERADWKALWADVEDLLKKVAR